MVADVGTSSYPAWTSHQTSHVDLATLQLIEGPGLRTPIPAVRFKRGDAANLEVVFLTNGQTAATIGNPATLELKFGVKARGRYDLGYLVHEAVWTMSAPAPATPIYGCSPSFNTEELNAALGVGSATGAELSEITLMGEITWREGSGPPTSTRTFTVIVENDVNRGTEGVPTDANPAYPPPASIALLSSVVRHDAVQDLTADQKTQARANLGLGSAATSAATAFATAAQGAKADTAWQEMPIHWGLSTNADKLALVNAKRGDLAWINNENARVEMLVGNDPGSDGAWMVLRNTVALTVINLLNEPIIVNNTYVADANPTFVGWVDPLAITHGQTNLSLIATAMSTGTGFYNQDYPGPLSFICPQTFALPWPCEPRANVYLTFSSYA